MGDTKLVITKSDIELLHVSYRSFKEQLEYTLRSVKRCQVNLSYLISNERTVILLSWELRDESKGVVPHHILTMKGMYLGEEVCLVGNEVIEVLETMIGD